MSEPARADDLLLVLHPREPLHVLLPVVTPDPPPTWAVLLAAAATVAPDGAWPLGPHQPLDPPDRVGGPDGADLYVVLARSGRLAAGRRWLGAAEVTARGAEPQVAAALADRERPFPPGRPAWMLPGWWDDATAWVDARLADAGLPPRAGRLEPHQHWGISAVARVRSAGADVWVKAVPRIFVREPAVTAVLASVAPGRVPRVIAADEERFGPAGGARFLLTDAGPVPDDPPDADRPRLAAALARVQVATLPALDRLRAAGCADRGAAALADGLERLARDCPGLARLDPAERVALRGALPALLDDLRALHAGPLPPALLHGDYHPWNVARPSDWQDGDEVVLDWTDAAVGVAAGDLVTLLPPTSAPELRDAVARAYADTWADALGVDPGVVLSAVVAATPAGHAVQLLGYDVLLEALGPLGHDLCAGVQAQHLRALLAWAARQR